MVQVDLSALTTAAAPPTAANSERLVVVVETSVTAAAAAEALGVPVTPVRISWTPIAGTATGMKTDSRGLAGRWRSVFRPCHIVRTMW